jgi:hypothetical protein
MNYIPDFDHQCFVLEFQCEHCGLEVFDHIKQDTAKAEHNSSYTETMLRYSKRLDESSTESYQLALKTPCVKGGEKL